MAVGAPGREAEGTGRDRRVQDAPASPSTSSAVASPCSRSPMTYARAARRAARGSPRRSRAACARARRGTRETTPSPTGCPRAARCRGCPRRLPSARRACSCASGRTGAKPTPQLPSTTVVTPCQHDGVRCGSHVAWPSKCVCTSTKPGVTSRPSASSSRRAGAVDAADLDDARRRRSPRRPCGPARRCRRRRSHPGSRGHACERPQPRWFSPKASIGLCSPSPPSASRI